MQVFTDRTWGHKKPQTTPLQHKQQTFYVLICYWFKPLGSFWHLVLENTVSEGQKETVVQTSTELNF